MCGPVQTNNTGTIGSSDESLKVLYGGNVKCMWVIKPKTPYKMIMLEITHLSMESSNDCERSHVKVCLFIFSSYFDLTLMQCDITSNALGLCGSFLEIIFSGSIIYS